jgi:cytochrome c biogenesis protein CcdA/thiol-disulfide isomerase/thioredoxin
MAVLLAFAFVSGIVTILSPCILPVLPIVLAGSVGRGKARPLGVVAGFVVSFAAFTLGLTAIVRVLGLPSDVLRYVAVVLLVLLGFVMLVPRLRQGFEGLASRIAGRVRTGSPGASAAAGAPPPGFWRGLPVGFTLGLVWAPCVGPIMASVIALALTGTVDGAAVLITLSYTLGTAIPMFAVMLGGRALLSRVPWLARNMAGIQRAFGALMILIGVVIALGWDRQFQSAILRAFPRYGTGLTALEDTSPVRNALEVRGTASDSPVSPSSGASWPSLEQGVLDDYGPAPGLVAGGPWFNTSGQSELSLAGLRGKVVLVDFWTYSCVNCVRTIPYLQAWYGAYRDLGLVILGVHTPEFEFEKKTANLERAIRELGVSWPVVQDNDYTQWRAYGNHYWPAHYLIDASGHLRYVHYGEGRYEESERVIRRLLREAGANPGRALSQREPRLAARTPETYLGWDRTTGFVSTRQPLLEQVAEYQLGDVPGNGEWALSGSWVIDGSYVESSGSPGGSELQLGFNARKVYLVIEPQEPGGSVEVRVDGRIAGDTADVRAGVLSPQNSRLYQLVDLSSAGDHLLELRVEGKMRLFAFTFG